MADIFISYARKDQEKAQRLAETLARQGWSVWWDRRIPTGRRFHQVIERELTAARCVVALWSKASVSSSWVWEEAEDGLNREILVPARIETIPLPLGFRTVQTADLKAKLLQGSDRASSWLAIPCISSGLSTALIRCRVRKSKR